MSKRRSAVVLQRTQHWIGVDLVARTRQVTTTVIAADVIAERSHCASVINKIAGHVVLKDRVGKNRYCVAHPKLVEIIDALTRRFSHILRERAVRNLHR